MSQVKEKEEAILKKADEIRDKNNRFQEKAKRTALEKLLQGMCGKFFKTLDFTDEKKEFFRVFHDDWRDNQVKVERWKYFHDSFYQVNLETWYADNRRLYDEEITEIEFMEAVTWWMKKVGVFQIITQVTDH